MLLVVVSAIGFYHTIPGLDLRLQERGLYHDGYLSAIFDKLGLIMDLVNLD